MNTEITRVAESILFLATTNREVLYEHYSRESLDDLLHECDELRKHEDFSVRTAAEIIRYGCTEILNKPKTL